MGACMAGGMYGEWGCMWQGDFHGKWGMCGREWCAGQGACMLERRPLKRAVHILLEYILVEQ